MRSELVFLLCAGLGAQTYDTVIAGGRVMDPESNLDAVRDIGIRNGRIETISQGPLKGRERVDAKGLVVSPGFIDLHRHAQDPDSNRYAVMDGVTSSLELEIGTADVAAWYAQRADKSIVHHGVSVGHPPVRMAVMKDPGDFLPSGDAANRAATEEEITEFKRRIERGLQEGAVAVGFGIAYTQAATHAEILEMFRVAARFGAVCHVHMRGAGTLGREAPLLEVIAASTITGAPLHVVHINSSSAESIERMLGLIAEARGRGMDLSTEAYPYTAGATRIESALFANWESRPDSYFPTLQWPPTGERLTRESFARYRKQGGRVIMHSNTEERVRTAILSPLTMIASDGGGLPGGAGHPRSSGTFTKVLGRYVREQKALSLTDALRKMTIMPAQRLEKRVPSMRSKGRIRVGADADLAIFDPERVIDRSTYENPAQFPDGMRHVLVNGVAVVRDGALVEGVFPGQAIRASRVF